MNSSTRFAARTPRPSRPFPASAREQALSALLNLGYAKAQAERVLADVERDEEVDDESVESMVRAALKRLAR